jgi:F-type H+-transporting ATPase subunit b
LRVLPDLSVLFVIVFVLACIAVLNALIFKPLVRVMEQREHAIRSARELAEQSAAEAQAATAEFEARTRAARAEVYREMDDARRAGLARRAEILDDTRREAEAQVAQATAQLRAETEVARRRLEAEAESLGAAIVDRVLDRRPS